MRRKYGNFCFVYEQLKIRTTVGSKIMRSVDTRKYIGKTKVHNQSRIIFWSFVLFSKKILVSDNTQQSYRMGRKYMTVVVTK